MYFLARLKVKDEKKKLFAELIVGEADCRMARLELSVARAMMNALFARNRYYIMFIEPT